MQMQVNILDSGNGWFETYFWLHEMLTGSVLQPETSKYAIYVLHQETSLPTYTYYVSGSEI